MFKQISKVKPGKGVRKRVIDERILFLCIRYEKHLRGHIVRTTKNELNIYSHQSPSTTCPSWRVPRKWAAMPSKSATSSSSIVGLRCACERFIRAYGLQDQLQPLLHLPNYFTVKQTGEIHRPCPQNRSIRKKKIVLQTKLLRCHASCTTTDVTEALIRSQAMSSEKCENSADFLGKRSISQLWQY